MGVGPDLTKEFALGGVAEFLEVDAVVGGVGEAEVGSASAGEFGVKFNEVADVANDEEGRTAFVGRDSADIIAGLVVGFFEGLVPSLGAAFAVANLAGGSGGSLLGLEDEVVTLVEVEVDGGGVAVFLGAGEGAVDDVGVVLVVFDGGIGAVDTEEVAELGEEERVVGTLGRAGVLPTGDEGFDVVSHGGILGRMKVGGRVEW